ncbi:hypothetical protein PS627_04392 [Pseudomonas fluorescens]|uniref:BrnT family toxin n=1 Tax=Pseudomonas fluorescens TaxID=294 RepID=UPI001259F72B|nr:BrnT family toxin [Pseudomonas fluorescens]CAG8871321.1 hypothetical protein PS627_04392 [Pseudomonas fluorescens]VVP82550.1 hypothetical protein PS910_02106 [Pseudomonas fluorescens]
MHFEWDKAKNLINIRKHGIDFSDVPAMFEHPVVALRDDRMSYGEERWVGIGLITRFIGVVVYTERRGNVIRIISARKATREEAKHYVQSIEN